MGGWEGTRKSDKGRREDRSEPMSLCDAHSAVAVFFVFSQRSVGFIDFFLCALYIWGFPDLPALKQRCGD